MPDNTVFDIDPERLDQECVVQPRLVLNYGNKHAEAKHELDQAESRLELVGARLQLAIRSNPSNFDLRPNPNNDEVKAAMIVQGKYQKAQDEINNARRAVATLAVATNVLEHRKRMLENLVELNGRDYHSEPRVGTAGNGRMRDKVEERRHQEAFGSSPKRPAKKAKK